MLDLGHSGWLELACVFWLPFSMNHAYLKLWSQQELRTLTPSTNSSALTKNFTSSQAGMTNLRVRINIVGTAESGKVAMTYVPPEPNACVWVANLFYFYRVVADHMTSSIIQYSCAPLVFIPMSATYTHKRIGRSCPSLSQDLPKTLFKTGV